MRHPGLDPKEYEYIEENWVNPVQKLVGDAIFETQKIYKKVVGWWLLVNIILNKFRLNK